MSKNPDVIPLPGKARRLGALLLFALSSVALPSSSLAQSHVPGRVLIKFSEGQSQAKSQEVLAAVGARIEKDLPQIGVKVLVLPDGADEEGVANALAHRPGVEFAEVDRVRQPTAIAPNDPWYLNWQTNLTKIACPDAWVYSTGSPSVVVAVLDTGVESGHPDLAANVVSGWNAYSSNSDTSDQFGHGTAVSGTIGAISNNGIGVASVAWGCRLMPIRICSSASASSTDSVIAAGLNWAADHGATVANVSYDVGGSATFASACRNFQSKGGVVTVSAGNQGMQITYAASPYYLVVGATTQTDALATYSNYGPPICLVAPGYGYSTNIGGGYSSVGGTSFSAPLVAGVAALMKSANPSLSGPQLMSLLSSNCDDLGAAGWDTTFGYGRLNARKCLIAATNATVTSSPPPVVSFVQPTNGVVLQGPFPLSAQASGTNAITSMTISIDGVTVASSNVGSCSYSWNTQSSSNGNHVLVATAKDSANNSSTSSVTVSVLNPSDTTPPTVAITSPTGGRIGNSVSVKVNAADNVAVTRVELYVDGKLTATATAAPFTISWNSRKVATGAHTLQCKAYDAASNSSVSQIVAVTK